MQILEVIPIAKSARLETLSYFSAKKVSPGQLVKVPLRKKEILALVTETKELINLKAQIKQASFKMRNVLEVYDHTLFSPAFLKTCSQLKNFYLTTTGKLINEMSPSWLQKENLALPLRKSIKSASFQHSVLHQKKKDRIVFYRSLIREKILHGESLHIISPTKEDVDFLYTELSKNIEEKCFFLHSGLSQAKAKNTFKKITQEESSTLLISTPLFIDTYQHQQGTLILEEASSEHYLGFSSPFIDMRDFIEVYAKESSLSFISADSVIRPEIWYKIRNREADLIDPHIKKIFKEEKLILSKNYLPPENKKTDTERYQELLKKNSFEILGEDAKILIEQSLKEKKNLFLFVPKKGLASVIHCNDCGNIARSPSTGHPLSLFSKKGEKGIEYVFIAKQTGEKMPAFDTCQFCSGNNLNLLGTGTQSLEQSLIKKYPKAKILCIDGDHIKTKKQQETLKEKLSKEQGLLIIGTTKAFSFLKNISSSVLVSIDPYFAILHRSLATKILKLVSTIVEKTDGKVLLQIKNIVAENLPILQNGIFSSFIKKELQTMKELSFPPYKTLIAVKKEIPRVYLKREYQKMQNLFKDYSPEINVENSKKKSFLSLYVYIRVDTENWNYYYQEQKISSLLSPLSLKSEIRINPEYLNF